MLDGSNDYYDAAGVLLEPHPQPNGDVWYVDTQGRTERVDHADGSYELSSFAVDGSYVAHGFDAQGVEVRQVAHDPAGLVLWTREVGTDGSFTVTYASGLVDHFRSDATLATRTLVNGDTESYDLTGTRLTQVEHTAGGRDVFTWLEDASHTVSQRDSADVQFRLLSYDSMGTLLSTRDELTEGAWRITLPDGRQSTYRADGSLSLSLLPNGDTITWDATGTRTTRGPITPVVPRRSSPTRRTAATRWR